MSSEKQPEVWLRGALPDVPPLLQPVAHALLQVREESAAVLRDFPDALLWLKPAGAASVGFHLQHMSGVVDRLFAYARGEALSDAQRAALAAEGIQGDVSAQMLLDRFAQQVDVAIAQLRATEERTLTDVRTVGRLALPSTVMGLLFHAAEHTQRHLGQMLVTARFVKSDAMGDATGDATGDAKRHAAGDA